MDNQNKENRSNLIHFETKDTSCFGTIIELNEEGNKIYVDYEENPYEKPLVAWLAYRISYEDLKFATEKQLKVKLIFENGDYKKPVIERIDFSYFDEQEDNCQDIHIKGNKIVFEADSKIVLKSGSATAVLTASNGKFTIKGENIESSANLNNDINGASVSIN
ncbi:MAG: hypothetical protein GY714_21630 [Desulfobacterales bacterium]|nr:hypothetical protein [Desulfobacterales bacterium]